MPLQHYGVLTAHVLDSRREGSTDTPHFQIHLRAGQEHYRVAVNVLSQVAPSELLFVAVEDFHHPMLDDAAALDEGFTPLPSVAGGLALDFIRGNLFDRSQLRVMPATQPGPDNDLADLLAHYVDRAVADPTARLHAFGQRWGPEQGVPDKIFGFAPGNGVHDIHMNQGNVGAYTRDDGVFQDGGLLLEFPGTAGGSPQWVAIFLAFQSQSWHTDDATGHSLDVGPEDPQGRLRLVAALVNPVGPAPESETVTLINTTATDVDLDGWSLADRLEHRMPLPRQRLAAGETVRLPVVPPVQLGNNGGTLTLLDPEGLKVDGVAYTAAQAAAEGVTVVF